LLVERRERELRGGEPAVDRDSLLERGRGTGEIVLQPQRVGPLDVAERVAALPVLLVRFEAPVG
jgi:hypothetical protein